MTAVFCNDMADKVRPDLGDRPSPIQPEIVHAPVTPVWTAKPVGRAAHPGQTPARDPPEVQSNHSETTVPQTRSDGPQSPARAAVTESPTPTYNLRPREHLRAPGRWSFE